MEEQIMNEEESQETEIEAKAREHGWVPEADYKGDKTNYVDAETWESRSKRERLLEAKDKKQDAALKELGALVDRMNVREKTLEERAKKKAMKEWKAIAKEGFAENDEKKLDEALDSLEKEKEEAEPYSSDADYAAAEAWVELHPEYKRGDVAASATAESLRIQKANPGLPISEIFKKVHKEMTKIYPEHFENKERDKPQAVEGSGQRLAPKKGTMSAEFKQAMEKYGNDVARTSAYKGKSGKTGQEGFEADKQRAMDDYKRSFDTELTDTEKAL